MQNVLDAGRILGKINLVRTSEIPEGTSWKIPEEKKTSGETTEATLG